MWTTRTPHVYSALSSSAAVHGAYLHLPERLETPEFYQALDRGTSASQTGLERGRSASRTAPMPEANGTLRLTDQHQATRSIAAVKCRWGRRAMQELR